MCYDVTMNITFVPSPVGHLVVSILKSVLRILAGVALIYCNFPVAGALFILAEVGGIVEELV